MLEQEKLQTSLQNTDLKVQLPKTNVPPKYDCAISNMSTLNLQCPCKNYMRAMLDNRGQRKVDSQQYVFTGMDYSLNIFKTWVEKDFWINCKFTFGTWLVPQKQLLIVMSTSLPLSLYWSRKSIAECKRLLTLTMTQSFVTFMSELNRGLKNRCSHGFFTCSLRNSFSFVNARILP